MSESTCCAWWGFSSKRGASAHERAAFSGRQLAGRTVSDALFIGPETVRQHPRLHEAAGIKGLEKLSCRSREPVPSQAQHDTIEAENAQILCMTAKAVCRSPQAPRQLHTGCDGPTAETNGVHLQKSRNASPKADAPQQQFTTCPLFHPSSGGIRHGPADGARHSASSACRVRGDDAPPHSGTEHLRTGELMRAGAYLSRQRAAAAGRCR